MANYSDLKASIAAVIKTNNRKEITGQILQDVLNQMVNVIGENLQLAGFADPLTNPGTPDQNVFYITDQGGAYSHFGNITLDSGLSFLMWKNGAWTSHTIDVVTKQWLDQHYVSIDYFRSLFRAYDANGLEIMPNNDPAEALPTAVGSIKAMVGLWTEQYLSALGQGTGGGGGGGATELDQLNDVYLTSPQDGQSLVYDGTLERWVNKTIQAGITINDVWSALAGNTNQQINASHLTTALSTYATQQWVGQNYISIAFFDRLFRAYNGNTLVSPNDTTTTIDNIKAMFGFWTEAYLSALGNNGGGGASLTLAGLSDVQITSPQNGQALVYNSTLQKWVAGTPSGGTVTSIGMTVPTGLSVTPATITASGTFAITLASGYTIPTSSDITKGVTAYGWGNHANAGYATQSWVTGTALSGYATQSWVNTQISGMATQSWVNTQISDMATKTWVGNNYLPLTGGRLTGALYMGASSAGSSPFILWGDGSYVYIGEDADDKMEIYARLGIRLMGGNVGIGNSSPSYKLDVAGTIYASGAITALSDIRKKDVRSNDTGLTLEAVANAPTILFTWKDCHEAGVQVGTIAQYWQKVLPAAVKDKNDELSMQYGVAALVSAIVTARKVVDHERRITELERENKELKERLKAA